MSGSKNLNNLLLVILILVVLVFAYVFLTRFPLSFSTDRTFYIDQKDYELPEEDSCSDYHIASEYRQTYGSDNINDVANLCRTTLSGEWRESKSELGCYWDPDFAGIPCNQESVLIMEDFCENGLLAKWTCDNSIAYIGCLCKQAVPEEWDGDGDSDGDGDGDGDGDSDQNPYDKYPCNWVPLPNSQEYCDLKGYCLDDEESYCKFIPATSTTPAKCACTIDPSTIDSCERACWFDGASWGYCYEGPLLKNPCQPGYHLVSGDSYCPQGQSLLRTCCCQ